MGGFLSFGGRVAVVTGGARGIGLAITRGLLKHGAKVHVFDVAPGEGEDSYQFHKVDVADSASVNRAVARLPDRISLLVNNAGITRDRSLAKMSREEWNDVLQTNLSSVFHMTARVLPHMVQAGYGRIVNISSVIGVHGNFGQANYAAAKAGIIGFTKSAALELARKGVTVNAIAPGFIETEMIAAMPDEVRARILERIPMGRFGSPEEIAQAVEFLVSHGDYVTGQVIAIDGGMYT